MISERRSYFFSFMQQNGVMFNGSMNILYQNLIVRKGKVVRVNLFQISRKKFVFTASYSPFGSFGRTTKIIIKNTTKTLSFGKSDFFFLNRHHSDAEVCFLQMYPVSFHSNEKHKVKTLSLELKIYFKLQMLQELRKL